MENVLYLGNGEKLQFVSDIIRKLDSQMRIVKTKQVKGETVKYLNPSGVILAVDAVAKRIKEIGVPFVWGKQTYNGGNKEMDDVIEEYFIPATVKEAVNFIPNQNTQKMVNEKIKGVQNGK